MADKSFKTIEEQLEILRSRGLTINNEQKAKDFLLIMKRMLPADKFCEMKESIIALTKKYPNLASLFIFSANIV